MKAPGTRSMKGVPNQNSNRICEDLDSDRANEILDVENIAYHKKDFN